MTRKKTDDIWTAKGTMTSQHQHFLMHKNLYDSVENEVNFEFKN